MADISAKPGRWVGWVWHPVDLPEGYHTAPRGQAWRARPAVGRDAAPGEPRGRAMPGRRDATQLPACKIVSGCRASERRHDTRRHRVTTPGAIVRGRHVAGWGPHALHAGTRPARRLVARTALTPPLTRVDAYSHVLGVKGSQVRILSSRPRSSRSEGFRRSTGAPYLDPREPNGEPADVQITRRWLATGMVCLVFRILFMAVAPVVSAGRISWR
jgi:hypothetical protein